jgi:hypothetical protein
MKMKDNPFVFLVLLKLVRVISLAKLPTLGEMLCQSNTRKGFSSLLLAGNANFCMH